MQLMTVTARSMLYLRPRWSPGLESADKPCAQDVQATGAGTGRQQGQAFHGIKEEEASRRRDVKGPGGGLRGLRVHLTLQRSVEVGRLTTPVPLAQTVELPAPPPRKSS